MTLQLGTLTGFLDLDASAFDNTLGGAMDKLRDLGGKGAAAAAAAGAAIGAGIGAGVVDNLQMGPVKDKLSAQLGLTGPAAAEAGKVAAELYRNNFGDSLSTVNEAVRGVVQNMNLEINGADFQPITAQVMTLADTFDQDLNAVTAAAGQLLKTGLAPDATAAMDIVARGFQLGVDKSGDFLDTINEYGTQFRNVGLDGQAMTGLLQQGLQAGARDADIVADAVKEMSIRISDGTAADAMEKLGLNAGEMQRAFAEGGPVAAAAMDQVLDALRPTQGTAAAAAIAFGILGTQSEDLGDALYALDPSEAVKGLGDVEGAAQGVVDTMGDNAAGAIETYKRKLLGVGQDAIESVGPLAAVAGAAAAFGPAVLGVLGPIASMTAARAAQTAATAAATAAEGANTAATTGGTVARAAHAIATGVVTVATGAWTGAQWLLNAALSANPIGLVIAAVALLAGGLVLAYQKSETFRDVVTTVFDAVKSGVGNAVGFMIDGFRMLLTVWLTVADGIISGAAAALGWIPGLGGKLKAANTAFDNMKDGVLATLDEAAQKAYGYGENSGKNVAAGLNKSKGTAVAAAERMAGAVGSSVRAVEGMGYSSGLNAGAGLAAGLDRSHAAVAAAAQRLAITAGRAMASGLQERSPSKVTREIGMYAGEGLRLGMLDTIAGVAGAAGALAQAAVPGMAAPGGVRAIGGDGASSPTVNVAAPDLSDLVGEMRAMREEFRRQADRTIQYAYTEQDRVPA